MTVESSPGPPARYFVGVRPPQDITEAIIDVQKNIIKDKEADLRVPILPHVTLLNPFEAANLDYFSLVSAVGEVAGKNRPVDIRFDEITLLRKRALVIESSEEAGANLGLLTLRRALESAVIAEEDATDSLPHEFKPHITVFQSNMGCFVPDDVMRRVQDELSVTLPVQFSVDTIDVYGRVGDRNYVPYEELPLGISK